MDIVDQIKTEAIQYSHLGWSIVILHGLDANGICDCDRGSDCPYPGKHPRTTNYHRLSPATPQQLELYFQRWPNSNVGVVLGPKSGIIDIEFDCDEGAATADRLLEGFLSTPTYRSARSVHRLYRCPDGLGRQPAFQTIQGLEIRLGIDRGAQSVVPPSRHHGGIIYTWEPGLSPFEIDPMPFPQPLVDLLKPTSTTFTAGEDLANHPGAAEGQRNRELCRLIGSAIASGKEFEWIYTEAIRWNDRCRPPEDAQAVRRTVKDLWAKEQGKREATAGQTPPSPLKVRSLEHVAMEPDHFMWGKRLVVGSLNLIAGDGSVGKTVVCCNLAAMGTLGAPLPGDDEGDRFSTLIITNEDQPKTIRGRIEAAGGDPRGVFVLDEDEDLVDYRGGRDRIVAFLRENPSVRLVVLDTIVDLIGETVDDHKNASVRQGLKPLIQLAAECQVVVLGVAHFNKRTEGNAGARLLGSVAYRNLSRSVLFALPDPDEQGRRIIWHEKHSLAAQQPALAYEIEAVAAGSHTQPQVIWIPGEVYIDDIGRYLSPKRSGSGSAQLEDAVAWLEVMLPRGASRPANVIQEAAADEGISERTLKRARRELGVQRDRGLGTWIRQIAKS